MASPRRQSARHRHPANIAHYDDAARHERIADRVTAFLGSWPFIVIQSVIVALWIAANVWLLSRPFDPFPFILLNLAFSTQAAYAAPLILLAGNRQAQRDRLTLEHAAAEGDIGDRQNEELLRGSREILKRIDRLEERITTLERGVLTALGDSRPPDELDEA